MIESKESLRQDFKKIKKDRSERLELLHIMQKLRPKTKGELMKLKN